MPSEARVGEANARLYDPALGRFLSPDPYVQEMDFSQNFNRYSYCLNNPLRYVDPSGEFIVIDSWISGFFRGLFQGKNAWKTANQSAMNDLKIWGGLFASDPNKNFGERVWEIVSRFTWQLPQTLAGFIASQTGNLAWQVDEVDYWGGATVLSGNFWGSGGAITLGSYINGGQNLDADPENILFQHEYGHYLQSQSAGLFYLSKYGIPSALSKGDYVQHGYHPVEQDANVRALQYFMDNVKGFTLKKWEFRRGGGYSGHPISGLLPTYLYNSPGYLDALEKGRLKLEWFDYLLGPNIFISGIINTFVLNSRY